VSENGQDEPELYNEEVEEISESASVVTLYLSRQENVVNPTEVGKENREEEIKFVPAVEEFKSDRAKTAPPRPSTELEELRSSKQFFNLEAAAIAGSQLIQRADNKFDLESIEGQDNCKKFLQELEKLFDSFKVPHVSRGYRGQFSQAYRVLYNEGSLCYLTEILDSAQEGKVECNALGFPFLWVNSEKYVFPEEILKAAEDLFNSFCRIKHVIRNIYNRYNHWNESLTRLCEENVHADVRRIINELRANLEGFDQRWTKFEQVTATYHFYSSMSCS